MANVIPFKRPSLKKKVQGKTLCSRGFHTWTVDKKKQFDVNKGRLVTVQRCTRCGATKTELT